MSLASVTALLLATAAQDNARPAPQVPQEETAEPEITVTARRREERAQDVPIAISVVGGETLERTGTQNVGQLTQIQPSVQFFSTNPRNSAVNIRGLGAPFGLTNDGIEQGVGIYIDQVYYSRVASATFDFLDVERLEVLRGPQGTLYGKNVTSGAVNITSRAPTFEPEGRLELSAGNLDYVQAKGSVSGPLGATVAARLAASLTHRRGTIRNVTTDRWVNERDNFGSRLQLLWQPSDRLSLTLSGDYNRQDPECCAQIYVRTGATQRPADRQFAALAAAFGYAPPSTNAFDRVTDLDSDLQALQSTGGVALRAELDLGPGTLTSVSAWRFWNWEPSNDRDFTGLPITTVSQNPSWQRQWTQELRYATRGDRAVGFTAGAFFFTQTLSTTGSQVQGPAASRWLLNPASASANDPAVLDGLTSTNDIGFDNSSAALFAQLSWRIAPGVRLQPGLRLNHDRKRGSYDAVVTTASGSTALTTEQRGVLAPQSYAARFSAWNLSWDLTASWEASADLLGYATYARSFKSGGINLSGLPLDPAGNPILSAASVRPETVDHFELGLKTSFLGRRGTFNLAAWWDSIRDYQAIVTNGQLGVIRGYLANADAVRVRGVEGEFAIRPSPRVSLYANLAFTDGRYVRFPDAPCPPELSGGTIAAPGQAPSAPGTPGGIGPANCDISGQWLPGISRWSASWGFELNRPVRLLGTPGELYLGVDGNARSRFSSNASRSIYTDITGYSVVSLRLGIRTDSRWNAYAWVRNALDAHYYEVLATQPGNTGLVVGQPGDPRTWGLTLSREF